MLAVDHNCRVKCRSGPGRVAEGGASSHAARAPMQSGWAAPRALVLLLKHRQSANRSSVTPRARTARSFNVQRARRQRRGRALAHSRQHVPRVAAIPAPKACGPKHWPPPLPRRRSRSHGQRGRPGLQRCAAARPGRRWPRCRQQQRGGIHAHPPPAGPLQLQDGQGAAGAPRQRVDTRAGLSGRLLHACMACHSPVLACYTEACRAAAAWHASLPNRSTRLPAPPPQMEVLQNELRCRRLPIWGRKDQVASSERPGVARTCCCHTRTAPLHARRALLHPLHASPLRNPGPAAAPAHPRPLLPDALAGVYTALMEEGLGLSAEESEVVDAQLGLSNLVSSPGAGSDDEAAAVAAGEAPSPEALAADPLLGLQASVAGRFLTHDNSERTLSNATGLQLSFLWGAAAPNGVKHATSCVMRTSKSVWLFECGEDAQRHLVRCGAGSGTACQWVCCMVCRLGALSAVPPAARPPAHYSYHPLPASHLPAGTRPLRGPSCSASSCPAWPPTTSWACPACCARSARRGSAATRPPTSRCTSTARPASQTTSSARHWGLKLCLHLLGCAAGLLGQAAAQRLLWQTECCASAARPD